MASSREHVISMGRGRYYVLPQEAAPVMAAEAESDSPDAVSEQRLCYLAALTKMGIPLVREGSPAEAFLVR